MHHATEDKIEEIQSLWMLKVLREHTPNFLWYSKIKSLYSSQNWNWDYMLCNPKVILKT